MPETRTTVVVSKPYTNHGVKLSASPNSGGQYVGDCPFCDKPKKFFVDADTGLYNCRVCGSKGNHYNFLQALYTMSASVEKPKKLQALQQERGFLSPHTLTLWGVVVNPLNGEILVPGQNPKGVIAQLYRYVLDKESGKHRLYCTTGMEHQLFLGGELYDPKKPVLYVCEGIWDAMAFWEMLGKVRRREDGGIVHTSNESISLRSEANVIGLPGAHVLKESWLELFDQRYVVFLCHNDHPRFVEKTNVTQPPASLEGVKRIVQLMVKAAKQPKRVSYLCWGDEGFTLNLPSGYDVRDALNEGQSLKEKVTYLGGLLDSIRPIPNEWVNGTLGNKLGNVLDGSVELILKECKSFEELERVCRKAMKWSEGLSRTLSCMLATVVSTPVRGDQLWMKIIGPPSSGKTVCAEAIGANTKYTQMVSNMRGFHSGYKSDKDGEQDHSLIDLLKNKTLITKDGDTLLQSPNKDQILAEARDIYDKNSSSHYRHGLRRTYRGICLTWLLCGTEAMRALDNSELGERFLDCVVVDEMPKKTERSIARFASRSMFRNMALESNGKADSQDDEDILEMRRMCGGYVEYLRTYGMELYKKVVENFDQCEPQLDEIAMYGEFVSYMRSRPSPRQREKPQRELCVRLTKQLTRLAVSLAVVMNKDKLDAEVMRRVRRVSLDTARGRTLNVIRLIQEYEGRPCNETMMASLLAEKPDQLKDLLVFMRKIGIVELYDTNPDKPKQSKMRYRLTPIMEELCPVLFADSKNP